MNGAGKKNVAVLFGGRSVEHEISIITGLEVISALDGQRYTAVPVYIDAQGRWWSGEVLLDRAFYKGLPDTYSQVREVALMPVPRVGGLTVLKSKGKAGFSLFGKGEEDIIPVDVYFPVFHGQFGEDGCVQGLFEMADVPYTGSGVLSSSVAMNKYVCKSVLHAHGIPVLPAAMVGKREVQKNLDGVRARILATKGLDDFPLFVKPVNLGSSIGVSKADNAAALDAGLAKVFQFDTEAIVEPCVVHKLEVNVSVLGGETPVASVVEIPVASGDVLSYEDKYMRGGSAKGKAGGSQRIQGMAGLTRVIDPEDLDAGIKRAVTQHALDAYSTLGCGGVVRFDFMLDTDTNQLYFNELNPLPGSMAHYLWAKCKPPVIYTEMLSRIIAAAFERKEQQAGLKRDLGFKAMFA